MEEFKDRLIAARERAGLSQTELGEISDMASTQISRYEAGRAVPRRAVTKRLADALGVAFEWLAHGKGAGHQFLVRLDPSKQSTLKLHADPETTEQFLRMAEAEGLAPDQFLQQLVFEHLKKVQEGHQSDTSVDSRLSEMKRRIEQLEERLGALPPK